MNKSTWGVTLLAGLLASGLLTASACAAADTDRIALEAEIHRWTAAVNARDTAALTRAMTEDVELLENGVTVTGREAAMRALREVEAHGKLVVTSKEITVAGDVAWHIVGLAQKEKNGVLQARGQAIEIWKRVNRTWKLHRRMVAGPLPPGVSLTRPPPDEPVLDRLDR
jgi:ketosteroid isomerase-like protein